MKKIFITALVLINISIVGMEEKAISTDSVRTVATVLSPEIQYLMGSSETVKGYRKQLKKNSGILSSSCEKYKEDQHDERFIFISDERSQSSPQLYSSHSGNEDLSSLSHRKKKISKKEEATFIERIKLLKSLSNNGKKELKRHIADAYQALKDLDVVALNECFDSITQTFYLRTGANKRNLEELENNITQVISRQSLPSKMVGRISGRNRRLHELNTQIIQAKEELSENRTSLEALLKSELEKLHTKIAKVSIRKYNSLANMVRTTEQFGCFTPTYFEGTKKQLNEIDAYVVLCTSIRVYQADKLGTKSEVSTDLIEVNNKVLAMRRFINREEIKRAKKRKIEEKRKKGKKHKNTRSKSGVIRTRKDTIRKHRKNKKY